MFKITHTNDTLPGDPPNNREEGKYPPVGDSNVRRDGLRMTLRQHYAGLAMQGLLASGNTYSGIADIAVKYADSLLAMLEKDN